jgi:hypothetical protein
MHIQVNLPPPTTPAAPSRVPHERSTTVEKLAKARDPDEAGAGSTTASEEIVDSGDQAQWDEDDIMLFFWGNSQVAAERHRKKQEECGRNMEQWREQVASCSSLTVSLMYYPIVFIFHQNAHMAQSATTRQKPSASPLKIPFISMSFR